MLFSSLTTQQCLVEKRTLVNSAAIFVIIASNGMCFGGHQISVPVGVASMGYKFQKLLFMQL